MLKNCGHSMKWKELAVNQTLLVMMKRRANAFFMMVLRKALKAAEVFATTRDFLKEIRNFPHLSDSHSCRDLPIGDFRMSMQDTQPSLATCGDSVPSLQSFH